MISINTPCHPEQSEGPLTATNQGSLALLGMTIKCSACTRSRAPREGSRGMASEAATAAFYRNPREDAFFELSFTARLLNGRVRRRLLAGEDRRGGKSGGGDQHDGR